MSMFRTPVVATALPWARPWVFTGIALAALTLAAVARLRQDAGAVLWLDETWTGAFASEPSLAALTDQVRNDANAPAYYYLMWFWARAFGLSNAALHAPSLIFSLITPAAAWLGLRRDRPILALAWAVLLATWMPGIDQSNEARCYPLLLFGAALSTLAHLRLMESPSLRRAVAWAACAACLTLVHYYAGVLALMQGLAFLALHRGRALKLFPAAAAFLPAFAWIAWHAPRIADFARPGVAWYERMPVSDLPVVLVVLAGGPLTLVSFVLAVSAGAVLDREGGSAKPDGRDRATAALWWVGGAAAAATVLCVAVGVLRPTLTYRYLTPFVPGMSLLAAAWVVRIGRARHRTSAILLVGPLAAVALASASSPVPTQRLYNFEVASAWLAETKPSRLVYFWDHPSTPVMARSQLDVIGGFFLRRAGLPIAVTPLYPTAADMNGPASTAAGSDAAVLWLYDTLVHDTSARAHPPRLSALDPGLECRDFGDFNIGIVACRRPPVLRARG